MKRENDQSRFAVCVSNEGYPASLELRKIYLIVEDEKAAKHGLIRIIDESGESYLYPKKFFVAIKLPQAAKDAFQHAA
jgi:hypothetical protein